MGKNQKKMAKVLASPATIYRYLTPRKDASDESPLATGSSRKRKRELSPTTPEKPIVINDSNDSEPMRASMHEAKHVEDIVVISSQDRVQVLSSSRAAKPAATHDVHSGGKSRKVGCRMQETHGNWGALITGHAMVDNWWSRSFSVGYRSAMADRRLPGIGIFRNIWGKRSTLNLAGFNSRLFGGGRGVDTCSIPSPRAGLSPAAEKTALENLWVMEREMRGGALGMALSEEDENVLQALRGVSEGAQRLFASLRIACHPMCGTNDYSSCRWFVCEHGVEKELASELVSVGLCCKFRSRGDVPKIEPHALLLLCLLTDNELRKLLSGCLGGDSKACKDRVALIDAIAQATMVSPPAKGSKFDGVRDGKGKKRHIQTTISGGQSGVLSRFPGALSDVLSRLQCIRVSDKAERTFHRLQILFFSASGHIQEDACALLLSDISQIRWGCSPSSSGELKKKEIGGFAAEDITRGERCGDRTAESGSEKSLSDKGRRVQNVAGDVKTDVCCAKAAMGASSKYRERKNLDRLESVVQLFDSLEQAVRVGDAKKAYGIVKEASCLILEGDAAGSLGNSEGVTCEWLIGDLLARTVFCGVTLLERDRRYSQALQYIELLLKCSCPVLESPSWQGKLSLRKAVDLHHTGKESTSLEFCESRLKCSKVKGEYRVSLQEKVVRLSVPPRRWKVPSFPSRKAEKRIIEDRCGTGAPEQVSLDFYASVEGGSWEGVHGENGVWLELFGVLFSDLILSPPGGGSHGLLPHKTSVGGKIRHAESLHDDNAGVWDAEDGREDVDGKCINAASSTFFPTRCMDAPIDFQTPLFYKARQKALDSRLADIQGGLAVGILRANWTTYEGCACVGVEWRRMGCQLLERIVRCMSSRVLAAVCSLLAQDYALWRHGLPDLLLWRGNVAAACAAAGNVSRSEGGTSRPESGEVMLVEVKGPGDSLSAAQMAWIDVLVGEGAKVEVCHVTCPT